MQGRQSQARGGSNIALKGLDLATRIARLIDEKKGEDIVILDVQGICNFTDYFVICNGQSRLQISALSDFIEQTLKSEDGQRPSGREGQKTTNWQVLDFGDVIVHLMTLDTREFYGLENIWGDAQVVPVPVSEDAVNSESVR